MNYLNTFIYIFKNSLTNIKYYPEFAKVRFTFVLKYISIFILIAAIVHNIVFAVFINNAYKNLPNYYPEFKQGLINLYPNELQLTLQNGNISTNLQEPINIKVPNEWINILKKVDDKTDTNLLTNYNLIVIDTSANTADFLNYKTPLLITKNSYAVMESKDTYKVHSLSEAKDYVITKALYNQLVSEVDNFVLNQLVPKIKNIVMVLVFTLWIIIFGLILSSLLVTHVFTSVFGLIISKILKVDFTYFKIYKMGLLISPFFVLIGTIAFYYPIPFKGLMELLLYTAVVTLALKNVKLKKS